MSRGGGDDYDEDFPNQGYFWWANAQRALAGKRGRKALAELREALLALPEKRLVEGAISTVALARKVDEVRTELETAPPSGDYALRSFRRQGFVDEATEKCEKEGPGVCAVGAYLWWKRVQAGEDPAEAMAALPSSADVEGFYLDETARLGEAAGLSQHVAYLLADRNDERYQGLTPEERYTAFTEWLDKELAEVPR